MSKKKQLSSKQASEPLRSEQDSAWKGILDAYFKEFTEFFYPDIAQQIDWSHGYIALDKELQAITTDAEDGKRFVDKLFKVNSLSGIEQTVLAHIEIQGQKEDEFPYVYFSIIIVYSNYIKNRL